MQGEQQPKGRILVVDDEEPVGRLLELWLTEDGYQVRRATSFEQASEWMGRQTFDLVTLDIMMPVVDGLQSLRWFREYHPDVGMVMATALGDIDLVVEAMRLGAYSYMVKPFKMDLVAHELARAMERQRLVAENRAYQKGLEQTVEEQTRELRAAYARLERQVRELEGRDRLVQCQLAGPSRQEAYQEILAVLHAALQVQGAVLYQPDSKRQWLAPVAAMGQGGKVAEEEQIRALPKSKVEDGGLAAQAFQTHQLQHQPGEGTVLPLLYQDEVLGLMGVKGLEAEEDRLLLERLGPSAALLLWAAQVKEELDSGQVPVGELLGLR